MAVDISEPTAIPDSQVPGTEIARPVRARLRLVLELLFCALVAAAGFLYYVRLLRAASILTYKIPTGRVLRAYDHFFGYRVRFTETSIAGPSGAIPVRIYSPIGETNPPPVVLVHGFAPNGNHDGYLNRVADRMAGMGYLVTLPTVPAETRYEVRASDLAVIGEAVRWTAHTANQQVALLGISFSGGLVIAAAADPSVSPDVKLIVCLSGYNNLDSIARYYIHERVTDPYGHPYLGHPPGPLVIVSPYLDDLVPPRDARTLESAIYNENRGNITAAEATEHMTSAQKQEFLELQQMKSPHIRHLYLDSLARHHAEIAAISPSTYLGKMHIPLYILHGSHDPVFPEGEVEWMRQETRNEPDVHIIVTPWIAHALVTDTVSGWEKFRVINFVEGMLNAAAKRKPLSR